MEVNRPIRQLPLPPHLLRLPGPCPSAPLPLPQRLLGLPTLGGVVCPPGPLPRPPSRSLRPTFIWSEAGCQGKALLFWKGTGRSGLERRQKPPKPWPTLLSTNPRFTSNLGQEVHIRCSPGSAFLPGATVPPDTLERCFCRPGQEAKLSGGQGDRGHWGRGWLAKTGTQRCARMPEGAP